MITLYDKRLEKDMEVMSLHFGKDGSIWMVEYCDIGVNPLEDGWYTSKEDDLDSLVIDIHIKL